jgi:hypothetical protein
VSWLGLAPDDPFGVHVLPYGVLDDDRVAVRVGDRVLDLTAAARTLLGEPAGDCCPSTPTC